MNSGYLFLATDTTLQKIENVPHSFWLKLAAGVLALIIVVILLRKLMHFNKFLLGGAFFIGFGILWFNWIYYRTEPKFLTPLINRIAPFFPTAGAYDAKQATTPVR
jgi:apolipoprotein N-acyltransferase